MKYKNVYFNEDSLRIINSYEPLASWFSINSFQLSYYELMGSEILFDFDNEHFTRRFNPELVVLKKMIDLAILWINSTEKISDFEKAVCAASAIEKIYNENVEYLGIKAKENYRIEQRLKDKSLIPEDLTPPGYNELKIQKLEDKKTKLLEEVTNIDEMIASLKNNNQKR